MVTALAADFDILDIAAAAVKVAHLARGDDADESEIVTPRMSAPSRDGARDSGSRGEPRGRGSRTPSGPVVKVFFGAGKAAGVRPADLVGAITGEAGIQSSALGAIQVTENFSVVEVPAESADEIIAAVAASGLRGKKVIVRRDRNT